MLAATGVSVANAGVSGGALSQGGLYGSLVGTYRAQKLLAEPGVTDLVMLIGTNDLSARAPAAKVLSAMSTVLTQAKAAGVTMWVATITPRADVGWNTQQESLRQQINTSILSTWLALQGGRPIDTDAAVRDPRHPAALLPGYDSGDHLHPNGRGSHVLGLTIGRALSLPVR